MSPKVTENYTNEKIQGILDAAKMVFIRKGFFDTTMQDIVNECDISRGGLYRYFSSTEEIFTNLLEVEAHHNENSFNDLMDMDTEAYDILKAFIEGEGENILNIKQSLIPAAYEFFIKKKRDGKTMELLEKRHDIAVNIFNKIIEYGIHKDQISKDVDPDTISNCIVTFIEGLIITAIATNIDENDLRKQISSFNSMLRIFLQVEKPQVT